MSKKMYYDFMDELSQQDIYEGLLAHGLFSDKLPPIFSSENFFNYCQSKKENFPKHSTEYIYYETMRNINIPRPLGIPNPVAYQRLCKCISDNWDNLKAHFKKNTNNQTYVVSKVHLRKMKKTKALFEMNYRDWKVEDPEPELLFGAKYIVHADISNCFPSIYTHALSWALVGKNTAKVNKKNKTDWYNDLDDYTRNVKYGETHGLLIGPHASNLLSEIILTAIDHELISNFKYTRTIDDYVCYVPTYDEGQRFLTELSKQLRMYDLTLNHKKTSIEKLPAALVEQWVCKLNTNTIINGKEVLNFKELKAYMDLVISLMQQNADNSAILKYAIKVLASKTMKASAKKYYINMIFHLVIVYPYLVSLLEEYIFEPFKVSKDEIFKIADRMYSEGIQFKNYEEVCYAVYYAIKYDFEIEKIDFQEAKDSEHCIFLLLEYLYFKKQKDNNGIKHCINYAKDLVKNNNIEAFWIYVYEVLPEQDLKDYWKELKKNKITFLKQF